MRFAWLVSLLALCSVVFAGENRDLPSLQRERVTRGGATYDIVTRQEGQKWIREIFVEDAEGWPHLIQRKGSRSQEKLLQAEFTPLAPPRIDAKQKKSMWETRDAWSPEWEKKFSAWIASSVDTDFFQKYHLATDCADVEYSLRWIFARMNHLPMANHLGANERLLSNETEHSLWGKLPTAENWWEDRRFLAGLDYVLENTFTHTLLQDSHPIALNADAVTPGAFILNLFGETGHTQIIYRTNYGQAGEVPFRIFQSTTPRQVRALMDGLPSPAMPTKGSTGLLRMNWALRSSSGTYSLLPASRHPDFSEEQYSPDWAGGITNFLLAIFKKLDPGFQISQVAQNLGAEIRKTIEARKTIVRDGYAACLKESCAPNTSGYEAWSTPHRDERVLQRVAFFGELQMIMAGGTDQAEMEKIEKIRKETLDAVINIEGRDFQIRQILWALSKKMASSDPRRPIAERWGLTPEALAPTFARILAETTRARALKIAGAKTDCPTYENCLPGSPAYQKWNTIQEDDTILQLLQNLARRRSTYCQSFSPELCAELNRALSAQSYAFDGKPLSLEELITRATFMRSTPGLPEEDRWGARVPAGAVLGDVTEDSDSYGNGGFMRIFIEPRFLVQSAEWLGQGGMDWILHRPSGKKAFFPGWALLDLKEDLALFTQGSRLQWVLAGQALTSLELSRAIQGAKIISADRVVVLFTDGHVSLLRARNAAWSIEKEWDLPKNHVSFLESILPALQYKSADNQIHGLFFHGDGITEIEMATPQGLTEPFAYARCFREICQWSVVAFGNGGRPHIEGRIFELKSGKPVFEGNVSFLHEFNGTLYGGQVADDHSRVFIIDPDRKTAAPILELPRSRGFHMSDDILTFTSEDNHESFYRFDGALSEKMDFSSCGKDVQITRRFVVGQAEGRSLICSRPSLKKILEGRSWAQIMDSGTGPAYLSEYVSGDANSSGFNHLFRIREERKEPFLENAQLTEILADGSVSIYHGGILILIPAER